MKEKYKNQMKNVPNILSGFRLALIPAFAMLFLTGQRELSGIMFMLAACTDALDGYIARKYDAISKLGRILDPVADKLMQFVALLCLAYAGAIPYWFAGIYMLKELVILCGGIKLFNAVADVMPSKILGKIAAVMFYMSITAIIFFKNMSLPIRYTLLTICLTLTLAAMVDYILSYSKYLKTMKTIREKP